MPRLSLWVVVALSVALLAGCQDPPAGSGGPQGAAEPSGSTTAAPTVGGSPSNTSFVPSASWSGCRGFRAGIPGPTSLFSFEPPPPGWESGNPLTEFDLRFFECDRVLWGGFERGPVQMLVEMGGSFQNPEACGGEHATLLRNLASWWFSDPQVADYAAAAYGVHAIATNFTIERQGQGGVVDQTWKWGLAGARSSARLADVDASGSMTTHVTRIFWFVGDGVYAMDLRQDWLFPTGSTQGSAARPVTGRLEDPMLYSSSSDLNDFVGRADRYEGLELSAGFVRFKDLACEQPF